MSLTLWMCPKKWNSTFHGILNLYAMLVVLQQPWTQSSSLGHERRACGYARLACTLKPIGSISSLWLSSWNEGEGWMGESHISQFCFQRRPLSHVWRSRVYLCWFTIAPCLSPSGRTGLQDAPVSPPMCGLPHTSLSHLLFTLAVVLFITTHLYVISIPLKEKQVKFVVIKV